MFFYKLSAIFTETLINQMPSILAFSLPATVDGRCFLNKLIAPCGALSPVHQRPTLMTRLATVLGPLIEGLNSFDPDQANIL